MCLSSQVVTAMGKTWHPEHFVCTHCQEEIGSRNFFERDGQPYCEKDYHSLFSPRCYYCNGPILDVSVHMWVVGSGLGAVSLGSSHGLSFISTVTLSLLFREVSAPRLTQTGSDRSLLSPSSLGALAPTHLPVLEFSCRGLGAP